MLKLGRLQHMACSVKFHIYKPTLQLNTNEPSAPFMAIISVGLHNHPPPPPSKLPMQVRNTLLNAIKSYGVSTATATRIMASNMLPWLLDNVPTLVVKHATLLNNDRINQIIRRERMREFPWGTDFLGMLSSLYEKKICG